MFRQASALALALTAFLLLVVDGDAETVAGDDAEEVLGAQVEQVAEPGADLYTATAEAVGSIHRVWQGFQASLPRLLIALTLLVIGWAVARGARWLARKVTNSWEKSDAISALAGIGVWLVAIGLATSVIAGDMRALLGSLGLLGLALSWALQTPIESFTAWLLNSFQGYYRVGDRVAVGEVFGDVVKIDFLTTTVWETGSPQRPGYVHAEQATGRVLTFPNSEVLTGTIVNLTRDFPYVWDELAVNVASESDLRHAMRVLEGVATELLGELMVGPATRYGELLRRAGLSEPVATRPQVFVSTAESWTDLWIRYLVPARERRKWKTELILRVGEALARPENAARVFPAYPRRQIQTIGRDGQAKA